MHRFQPSSTASWHLRILGTGAAVALVAAGCSSASEEGIEQLIESQSGGDVEIDLDDGSFSVESEDGSFSVDEDGNFVVEGEDGEVLTGQANEDGVVVEGEDGEVFSAEAGEDGDLVVESDDGSFEFQEGGDIPEEWPSEIPTPDGLDVTSSSVIGDGTTQQSTVTGTVDGSPADFAAGYGAALVDAGLTETGVFRSGDDVSATYTNDEWTVVVNGAGSSAPPQVVISVISNG